MKKFLAIVALLSVFLTFSAVLLKAARPSYCVHKCVSNGGEGGGAVGVAGLCQSL